MNTKITFHFILADNDVDGDDEAFTNGALEEICNLCIGHYGLFDGTEVKAKITNASIIASCGVTKDGRQKRSIYAEAEFPNNEHGRKLISKILHEKPIASIACSALNRDKVTDDVTMISNVTDFYNFSLRFDKEKETMNKNELERRLEAAEKKMIDFQDEIQNLKEKLADMQDEPEIPDMPDFKNREELFFAGGDLENVFNRFMNTNISVSDFNAFHTKAYAEEFRKKCLMIAMMLHCKWYLDRNYVQNWESDTSSEKWYVMFDHCVHKFQIRPRYAEEGAEVYFSTEEAAQKCADWLNEHWRGSDE